MSRSQSRRPGSEPGGCRFEQPERKGARALECQGTDAFGSRVKGTNPLAREAILSSALCFFTAWFTATLSDATGTQARSI
jgi:hypothetical protein